MWFPGSQLVWPQTSGHSETQTPTAPQSLCVSVFVCVCVSVCLQACIIDNECNPTVSERWSGVGGEGCLVPSPNDTTCRVCITPACVASLSLSQHIGGSSSSGAVDNMCILQPG